MNAAPLPLRVGGLIAAAGLSSRMGRAKALLPLGEHTFIDVMLEAFTAGGAAPVMVTVPALGGEVARHLSQPERPGPEPLVRENQAPQLGLSGSILTALDAMDVDALLFSPVDSPFVTAALVRELLSRLADGAAAACASFEGKRGHPLVVSARLFEDLRGCADHGGPRALLDRLAPEEFALVQSDDPRVLKNINSPAEYAAVFGRPPT